MIFWPTSTGNFSILINFLNINRAVVNSIINPRCFPATIKVKVNLAFAASCPIEPTRSYYCLVALLQAIPWLQVAPHFARDHFIIIVHHQWFTQVLLSIVSEQVSCRDRSWSLFTESRSILLPILLYLPDCPNDWVNCLIYVFNLMKPAFLIQTAAS